MSEPIMQKLEEMQALTCSSSVPLGVSVARHTDRLLAETRLELRKCIFALKAALDEHPPGRWTCGTVVCWECSWQVRGRVPYPCPTVEAITKALGVES